MLVIGQKTLDSCNIGAEGPCVVMNSSYMLGQLLSPETLVLKEMFR